MMATVPHVTSGLGLRKFQADGFLLTRVYKGNKASKKKKNSGATGFFSDIFPSDHTMVLGLTQPLVKISTRNIS